MDLYIKQMTNMLIDDQELYDECGKVFTYLKELKINFISIEYHDLAWQYSQIIEIVYSNKLENIELDIFDVILEFSNYVKSNKRIKDLIEINFNGTILLSKYRNNDLEIKYSIINELYKNIKESNVYSEHFKSYSLETTANESQKIIFEKLINTSYSNNSLYFSGLFLFLFTKFNKNYPLLNISRSVLINLYLMKSKLLFAPTLCFSYPMYNYQKKFLNTLNKLEKNPHEITEFSRVIFDFIKQAAIVNRAFVNRAILAFNSIEELIEKNKNLKFLKNKPINKLFEITSFNYKDVIEKLNVKDKNQANTFISELEKNNIIINISKEENKKIFMFKQFYVAIKKLDKNKKQATSEIFILRENLS